MGDGEVVIDTRLDDSGAKQGMGKLEKTMSKVGNVGKAAFGVVATGITAATAATGALVKSSVDAFSSYEQLTGGVNTLFKESSKQVQKYADDAYKTAGMSANEYMDTVTSFSASLLQGLNGDTKKASEEANKAIIDMSDNANKMGTNMADIQHAYQGFAKQNYTMLDNLKLGYGGTASEMARLVKDSGVLGDAGKDLTAKNLNEKVSFDQMVDAIHKVQTNMGITGTTAKEAATTVEGSINSMKASWTNLITGIGAGREDTDELTEQFIESVETAFNNLLPVVEKSIDGIGKLVDKLGPTIMEKAPGLIAKVGPEMLTVGIDLVTALGNGIIQALPTLLNDIIKFIPKATDTITDTLSNVGNIGDTFIKGIVTSIANAIPQLTKSGVIIITTLLNTVIQNLPLVLSIGLQIIDGIGKGITTGVSTLAENIPKIITTLVDTLTQSLPQLLKQGEQIIQNLANGLSKNQDDLLNAASEIIPVILEGIGKCLPDVVKTAGNIIISLADGMTKNLSKLVDEAPKILQSLIDGIVNNLPKIVEAGVKVIISLIDGMVRNFPKIQVQMLKLMILLAGTIIKNIPKIVVCGAKIIWSLIKGITGVLVNLVKIGVDIVKKIISGIVSMDSALINIGKNVVSGLWQGIKNTWGTITSGITGLFSGTVKAIKKLLGIHSPSKVMAEIGKFVDEGFAKGITDNSKKVKKSVTSLTYKVVDETVRLYKSLNKELVKINKTHNDNIKSLNKDHSKNLAELKKNYKDTIKDIKDDMKSFSKDIWSFKDIFTDVDKEEPLTEGDLTTISANQLEQVQKYKQAMDMLEQRNIPKQLMEQFKDMGVDSADNLMALANASDATFNQIIENYKQKKAIADEMTSKEYATDLASAKKDYNAQVSAENEAFNNLLEKENKTYQKNMQAFNKKVKEDFADIGKNIKRGLKNGTKMSTKEIAKIANNLTKGVIDQVKKNLGIHSPSKVFEKIGDYCIKGYDKAFDNFDPVSNMSKAVKTGISDIKAQLQGNQIKSTDNISDILTSDSVLPKEKKLILNISGKPITDYVITDVQGRTLATGSNPLII